MSFDEQFPVIIVLDIDGTLIGDITPQITLYDLYTTLRTKELKMNMKDFMYKLKAGVIRPYLGKFMKKLHFSYTGNIEYFIYTSAEKKWVHFLIPQIEKVIGIKFNKPLFTRDNCTLRNGEYKKNLDSVLPKIVKTLTKKYGKMNTESVRDRIMVIDNNGSVYDDKDKPYVLVCPTYD